ncbi:MAG TPA: hypothetical protein VFR67_06070 [Pilimelia sp.]|nr:hypothetical protein [Pilimelia sp.]
MVTALAGLALAVVGTGSTTLPAPAPDWPDAPAWTAHVDDVLAVAGPDPEEG